VFDLDAYQFNLLSVLNMTAALLVCYLGVFVFVRERYTPVSRAFQVMCLSAGSWLFCVSFLVAAVHEDDAFRWAKLLYIGDPLIPAAVFHFITSVLAQYERRKKQVRTAWAASAVFMLLLVSTDVFSSGLYHYSWGFYPKFTGKSVFFIGYFLFLLAATLRLLLDDYKNARPGSMRRMRARGFLQALLIAILGALDFLPNYGVPLAPVGALFVLAACGLAAQVIWLYRFVDVTPALAVNTIIDSMSDALLIVDPEGVIRHSNNAAARMFGMRKDVLQGKDTVELLPSEKLAGGVEELFSKSDVHSLETVYDGGAAGPRMLSVSASLIRDRRRRPAAVVYTAQDVTERRQAEEKIHFLAYYDPLTGLPNRTFYKEILGRAIAFAKRHKAVMATLFIDLDAFKQINDTYGHSAGDELLKAVAVQLTKCVRKTDYVARSEDERVPDTVSRLGGDEFIVLLNEIREGGDAARVALRILDMLSRPFVVGGHEVFVSASIGISLFPGDGDSVESLLMNADAAMYVAKDSGKNRYQFYTSEMNAASRERLGMEAELRRAVEAGQFLVYYQPRYELKSATLAGMEALVRWNHPTRGILLPEEFVPLAEETGLIIPLGELVLREVCRQAACWISEESCAVPVSINLSGRQCEPRLLDTIKQMLAEQSVEPRFLALEITESAIMLNPDKILELLKECRRLGMRIAIDDFGTGYSSLAQLRYLPVDALKIDRSFLKNALISERDAAVVRTIIAMGRELKLSVAAEGVETAEQFVWLRSLGCDEAQGYHFCAPVPAKEAAAHLKKTEGGFAALSFGATMRVRAADNYQI
jgi:diguanylate cyclase (GGDEF)-like protein/PAS domain S-box-containing protein